MNLFDLMGPVAVAGGLGFAYGSRPGGISWLALFVAACAGVIVFVGWRRAAAFAAVRSEKTLPLIYLLMPLTTLLVTAGIAGKLAPLLSN